MNTLFRKGRTLSLLTAGFILCALSIGDVQGQDLSKEEALQTASEQARKARFSQIFFSKQMIAPILEGAEQIQVSSGLDGRLAVLMIIGLDGQGREIGDTYLQSNTLSIPDRIDRATKEKQVKAAQDRRGMTSVTSSFSSSDLLQLLQPRSATGLMFLPSTNVDDDGNEVMTLAVGAATSPGVISDGAVRRSPCPPICDL